MIIDQRLCWARNGECDALDSSRARICLAIVRGSPVPLRALRYSSLFAPPWIGVRRSGMGCRLSEGRNLVGAPFLTSWPSRVVRSRNGALRRPAPHASTSMIFLTWHSPQLASPQRYQTLRGTTRALVRYFERGTVRGSAETSPATSGWARASSSSGFML
jgi:hypothetical protein